MILSVSRRTDVPAFYSEWFLNRIHEGYVLVPNPMNARQVSRIRLDPQVVECIVFWSKNPAPLLLRLDELRDYRYYFQFTVNAYGRDIEPGLPDLNERVVTFQALSELVGPDFVLWRYDPILINASYAIDWHIEQFTRLASRFVGYTRQCIISFVDPYPKNAGKMRQADIKPLETCQMIALAEAISPIGDAYGIKITTCCEGIDLSVQKINHASCIDRALIEKRTGKSFAALKKDRNQRAGCGCVESIDLGMYNTCPYGCAYCYADFSPALTRRRIAAHDPWSPLLTGKLSEHAIIREREMRVYGSNVPGYAEMELLI